MAITSAKRMPSITHITVDGEQIQSASAVRDLGAWLDEHMTMSVHVKKVCQSAFANLHNIGRIRKYLDVNSTKRLVQALVMSRLDYNNALLYALPKKTVAPLQRVQNAAARVVSRTRKRDHITPVLRSLHWLPIRQRIDFKILATTHKIVQGSAPAYLSGLVRNLSSQRQTRATSGRKLHISRTRTSYGDRCFAVGAARLWNQLPPDFHSLDSIVSFKSELKTWLFRKALGE